MNNKVQDVLEYVSKNPYCTEPEILRNVWRVFHRDDNGNIIRPQNRHYMMIRNALKSGKLKRVEKNIEGIRCRFFYFIVFV